MSHTQGAPCNGQTRTTAHQINRYPLRRNQSEEFVPYFGAQSALSENIRRYDEQTLPLSLNTSSCNHHDLQVLNPVL